MPHRGRVTSGPVDFKNVLHEHPLFMPANVQVPRTLYRLSFARHELDDIQHFMLLAMSVHIKPDQPCPYKTLRLTGENKTLGRRLNLD
jgi:hypothetical protein